MTLIATNLERLREQIPQDVQLVGVSKFHPVEQLQQAYDAGLRHFGESRAQELAVKATQMPSDVCWHFIGHLQRNKVRQVVAVANMIESVHSTTLLQLINAEAERIGRRHIDVLLQVHVAQEQTKSGFDPDELLRIAHTLPDLPCVTIRGVMAMATLTDDNRRIQTDFLQAHNVFQRLREGRFAGSNAFNVLSMGMSHDWQIAVQCGSNHVRIGTAIFGDRT